MSSKDFVNEAVIKWCTGCGLNSMFYSTCAVLDELKLKNTVIVSGIGCSGRAASYFNLDTIHSMHGRAIPTAAGVKTANPKLNVVVFSGDGDLLSIGGNHLLHAARRNDNITVICNSNEVFGMTGGQASPTTRKGGITLTTPEGNTANKINIQPIVTSNEKYFYARTTPAHPEHLTKCLTEAMEHQGFAFVEVINPCYVNFGRRNNISTPKEILTYLRTTFNISASTRLAENQLGIIKNA
jgi:2-oxoglutarate/2-oxoacid ferredoxin oxidoreductase subunit beta